MKLVAESLKQFLNEAGINRYLEHMSKGDFAIMTAYRNEFDKKQNKLRNQKLGKILQSKKAGYLDLVGHWEEIKQGKEQETVDVTEHSFLIPRPKGATDEEFKNFIIRLGIYTGQDAVLIGENGVASLYFLDLQNKKVSNIQKLGTPNFKKINKAYSQIRKKPDATFIFESLFESKHNPDVFHKPNPDFNINPESFIEWINTDDINISKKEVNFILDKLDARPESKLYRYGLDTSGDDDTGLIDKIENEDYDLVDSDINEKNRGWKTVIIDDLIKVYIQKNDVANDWEDDSIYDGFYVAVNPDFAEKIDVATKEEYARRNKEYEESLASQPEPDPDPDWFTQEFRYKIRDHIDDLNDSLPFSIMRYGDYPEHQVIDIYPQDYDDKTNYTKLFLDTLKKHNIDYKIDDRHINVSTQQFLDIDSSWFKNNLVSESLGALLKPKDQEEIDKNKMEWLKTNKRFEKMYYLLASNPEVEDLDFDTPSKKTARTDTKMVIRFTYQGDELEAHDMSEWNKTIEIYRKVPDMGIAWREWTEFEDKIPLTMGWVATTPPSRE